jgi:hypothetical protein
MRPERIGAFRETKSQTFNATDVVTTNYSNTTASHVALNFFIAPEGGW